MKRSLLFLPDISGFTNFVQTTEISHSQHVISELLEVLINANQQDLELAEIEGDALFFYKEEALVSQEELLSQMEAMYTAFYSHLRLLEKNRICPCNACASAPNLELKIIAHSGELQFIEVHGNRKPFGPEVIEAHRLMKNSVISDNYVLISDAMANDIQLSSEHKSDLYEFSKGNDTYDGKRVDYLFANVDSSKLKLLPFSEAKKFNYQGDPDLVLSYNFPVAANHLMEWLTNYKKRHVWVDGSVKFEFNENEVTRLGTEHVCIINGKHLNFEAVVKDAAPEQLVYGERTQSIPFADEINQFFILSPISDSETRLEIEAFFTAKSPIKKLLIKLIGLNQFKKGVNKSMSKLLSYITNNKAAIAA